MFKFLKLCFAFAKFAYPQFTLAHSEVDGSNKRDLVTRVWLRAQIKKFGSLFVEDQIFGSKKGSFAKRTRPIRRLLSGAKCREPVENRFDLIKL